MKQTAALAALLLCAALTGCAREYTDISAAQAAGAALGEHIFIDGVNVSGMAPAEALNAVETAHTEALRAMYYTVTAGEDSLDIPAGSLPISYNTAEVILSALTLKQHWPAQNEPRELYTAMYAESGALQEALSREAAGLEYPATDASASYDPKADGSFSYTESAPGRRLDMADLAAKVSGMVAEGICGSVAALTSETQPEYTTDMARADNSLIAQFSTSFAGKTYGRENRVFNIEKAAQLLDGTTLSPGQELDMNAILGDRNEENGWRTATGIRDGAYVQEYGGGVCQVSSTLYNTALMADMEITERHHHSWPLGYIDIGRDATISTGGPNLRFINSSDASVTISAATDREAQTVTVCIYGRPLPDGMRIELTSERTATLDEPGTETEIDPSLPPGARETVREARRGKIAETHKLYYNAEGELIKKELVSEDKYRSIKGLVRVPPS